MNYRMIGLVIGKLMRIEGFFLILPLLVSLIYEENQWMMFLVPALFLIGLGSILAFKRPPKTNLSAREGFVIVALSWVVLSAFGALPFYLSNEIPSYIDAFFETVSGFTTTGASILSSVEAMSNGMLFWRSFTHWIGGMGILVFALAVLPHSHGSDMYLMRAEVPGPIVGKLVSRVRITARILYGIYVLMSIVEIILLLLGEMPLFDSVVHTFGTAGTGGFGIKNTSIAFYDSAYIDGVISVFMLLFGVNFNLFYFVLTGHVLRALRSEELKWYGIIVAVAVSLITLNILPQYESIFTSFRYAFFQVASIITTTGYSTADFAQWPAFSQCILLLLMLVGACAGSTGGGLKVARAVMLGKIARNEIKKVRQPRSVNIVRFEGERVANEAASAVMGYFVIYVLLLFGTTLLLSFENYSFLTTFSAVAATFNNIGPGLELVGPAANYGHFSDLGKLLLSFNMLAGRLEIMPMLILFAPSIWKRKSK